MAGQEACSTVSPARHLWYEVTPHWRAIRTCARDRGPDPGLCSWEGPPGIAWPRPVRFAAARKPLDGNYCKTPHCAAFLKAITFSHTYRSNRPLYRLKALM